MMATGWIKLHRDLLSWEWYQDINTKVLFIHLLLKANHEPKRWKGIMVERGQLVAGLPTLSQETGLSVQSVRTALKHLKKTREVSRKSNSQFSVITICNYDLFQGGEVSTNSPPIAEQQSTNNKQEVKKLRTKEINPKDRVFNFFESLKAKGVEEQVAKDWMLVRSKKKAANTQTAFNGLTTQIEKSGKPWGEIITMCCERSWVGFKAEWAEGSNQQQSKFSRHDGSNVFQEYTCP